MRTVTVDVTQEDIDVGIAGECGRCPLALAMTRALGREVGVGLCQWWFADTPGVVRAAFFLPKIAQEFRIEFDYGNPTSPITLTVEIDHVGK